MKFTTVFTNFSVFSLSVLSLVNSSPLAITSRDVYVPPILSPTSDAVWTIGTVQTVTWNVSNPPAQITNPVGQILLRQGDRTTNIVLAGNFSILLGSINVTVPSVSPAADYSVVLFGDSGNFSPTFSIEA